jgi:hypothetical protein
MTEHSSLFQGEAEQDHCTPRGVRHKGTPSNQSVASHFLTNERELSMSQLEFFYSGRRGGAVGVTNLQSGSHYYSS